MSEADDSGASEYEQRISQALGRIAAAFEQRRGEEPLPAVAATDNGDAEALAALRDEYEKLQAEFQRVTKDHAQQAREHEAARMRLATMDEAMQALRASQAGLVQTVSDLRAALAGQVDGQEAELVNRAMQAELEAASAQRQADAAEIGAIIDELAPLIMQKAEPQEDHDAPG